MERGFFLMTQWAAAAAMLDFGRSSLGPLTLRDRDGVECRRVVDNVVIERESPAMNRIIRSIDAVDLEGNANLGIKSTPRSLRLVQLL
jgi:hypothetical protein